MKAKVRETSACRCRCVSVSVQRYSVQYKGYNLIGVTTVEEGTTRGTTALVYWQALHSSLYTDAVQGWWSTPNWSDRRQGCTQVSTILLLALSRYKFFLSNLTNSVAASFHHDLNFKSFPASQGIWRKGSPPIVQCLLALFWIWIWQIKKFSKQPLTH